MVWYRYCGTKVDYCYRLDTTDPAVMTKFYPEHDWFDTAKFYKTFYMLQCGGDFTFDFETGCRGGNRYATVKTNTKPNLKQGGVEEIGVGAITPEERGDFEINYCCTTDRCTSAGLRISPSGLMAVVVTVASLALTAYTEGYLWPRW